MYFCFKTQGHNCACAFFRSIKCFEIYWSILAPHWKWKSRYFWCCFKICLIFIKTQGHTVCCTNVSMILISSCASVKVDGKETPKCIYKVPSKGVLCIKTQRTCCCFWCCRTIIISFASLSMCMLWEKINMEIYL